ncbi:MAG TPA: hypothetical protein VFA07_02860 [Chthonomonadaceae bacterium]|nr:hypothetical protein [Chthonomonadaceae bacterium]
MEIGSGSPEEGATLTRRQFSRKVAGSAAGLLLCSAAEGQEAPATPKETSYENDPRIASLEKERNALLTPDQRKRLPGQLKDLDEGATGLRKFPLPDGGGEPRVVFYPIEPDRLARIRAAHAAHEEGSNG